MFQKAEALDLFFKVPIRKNFKYIYFPNIIKTMYNINPPPKKDTSR